MCKSNNSSQESLKLVQENTIHFMERMKLLDEMLSNGKLDQVQADKYFQLEKHAFEAMAAAEKHISKENTKKLLVTVTKKLLDIAVSQGVKALLLAL